MSQNFKLFTRLSKCSSETVCRQFCNMFMHLQRQVHSSWIAFLLQVSAYLKRVYYKIMYVVLLLSYLMDVLLSPAHTFEESYPRKIATRLPICFVHAGYCVPSKFTRLSSTACETNQFHFSLSPLDIISTVVTRFLSPAIGKDSNWALCWQASTHGWAVSIFHSRCDGKNHTITVIKKDQYVFGGYTDIPWCK